MQIQNAKLTLLEIRHNEGVSKKTGKPYSIYSAVFGDEDYNKLNATIGKDCFVDGVLPEWVQEKADKKDEVECDLRLLADGFGVKLTVDEIRDLDA